MVEKDIADYLAQHPGDPQLTAICNLARQVFGDVGRLRGQRDDEAWMHAACLSIAEGVRGYADCVEKSLAITKVKRLRQDYEAATKVVDIAVKLKPYLTTAERPSPEYPHINLELDLKVAIDEFQATPRTV